MLKEGAGDAPLLVLASPTESLAGYTKLIVDPVEVWYGAAARAAGTSEEELAGLADSLHAAIVHALSQDYEIVAESGPGTLRLRAALTEAVDEKPIANTLTTFIPPLRRAMLVVGRLGGLELWTGAASVEGEVLDSVTGERLMAAIDKRIGTRSLTGSWTRWSDVQSAFAHWAERTRARMAQLSSAPPE